MTRTSCLSAALRRYFPAGQPVYAISPHLDDAIWSVGCLLKNLIDTGYDVRLVSIFTHCISVYDQFMPPVAASLMRQGEDYAAARACGIRQSYQLGFPDAVLRDMPVEAIFEANYELPQHLRVLIAAAVQAILPPMATLLVPAGYGGHVDHMATRNICAALPYQPVYYTDLPYGARPTAAKRPVSALTAQSLPLDASLIADHLELFWYYRTQASEAVAQEIEQHLSSRGLTLWATD